MDIVVIFVSPIPTRTVNTRTSEGKLGEDPAQTPRLSPLCIAGEDPKSTMNTEGDDPRLPHSDKSREATNHRLPIPFLAATHVSKGRPGQTQPSDLAAFHPALHPGRHVAAAPVRRSYHPYF